LSKIIDESKMKEVFTNSTTQEFDGVCFGMISNLLYEIWSKFSFLLLSDDRVTISVYLFKFSDGRRAGFFSQVCLLYALITLST